MNNQRFIGLGLVIGLAFLLFQCATSDDVQILDNELLRLSSQVNALQRENENLKKETEMTRNDSSSFRKEVQTLQGEQKRDVAGLQKEGNVNRADLQLRIENLQSELRTLSAGVEEYKELSKRPSKDVDRVKEEIAMRTRILEEKFKSFEDKAKPQEERYRSLEEKNRGLEERLKGMEDRLKGMDERSRWIEERIRVMDDRLKTFTSKMDSTSRQGETEKPLAREKEPVSEARTSSAGSSPGTGAGSLYNDAYQTFLKGDLEGARKKFEAFLKQYPNTDLSDNAQFWMGETYFQKKDYERAILEYEKVISKFPEGDKVSSALYKQAIAFSELGDKANARNLLRRLIEKYPQSDQAEMAKKRLEAMK